MVHRPGGARRYGAPEIYDGPGPEIDGAKYGIERRVVVLAPDLEAGDVMAQSEASRLVGMTLGALGRQMGRGNLTVVWDLVQAAGGGKGSRRLLLRSEVLELAAGDRVMSHASYRKGPPKLAEQVGRSKRGGGGTGRSVRPAPPGTRSGSARCWIGRVRW